MKRKHQVYFRLNLMSLFLIAISFISVTLAWFAYSGLSTVSTEVDVKAWYIELEKNGEKVSNDIVISLSDIYPGMNLVKEIIKIKNPGDSDAEVKYSIVEARILGDSANNYTTGESVTTEYVEDLLSHEFPFSVNINLSKKYVLSKGEESIFEISVSWPLDSGADLIDSEWGNKAYAFQANEINKKNSDSNYQVKPSIQIKINLTAEQYLENAKSSDFRYNLGDEILIDTINNSRCESISPTCIKMYVIDPNNTLGDSSVTLLPNPYGNYQSSTYNDYDATFNNIVSSWQVNTRPLLVEDLMKVISRDVTGSLLKRNGISDAVIGSLSYPNRISKELNKVLTGNGSYTFINDKFPYLISTDCYWMQSNYNNENAFALRRNDDNITEIYGNLKSNSCKVIPIVTIEKNKLQ